MSIYDTRVCNFKKQQMSEYTYRSVTSPQRILKTSSGSVSLATDLRVDGDMFMKSWCS